MGLEIKAGWLIGLVTVIPDRELQLALLDNEEARNKLYEALEHARVELKEINEYRYEQELKDMVSRISSNSR